jgi:hypothetical protein
MAALVRVLLGFALIAALVYLAMRRYWGGRDRFAFVQRRRQGPGVSPERVPADPRELFRDGARLRLALPAAALAPRARSGDHVTIRVERVGELHVSSGRLVACDPLAFPGTAPFAGAVKPGRYPVDVGTVEVEPGHSRVAALRVVFADRPPIRWELADNGDLAPGGAAGYPVDAGLGCVMDETAADSMRAAQERLGEAGNYYDDVLATQLANCPWLDHHPLPDRPDNVVIVEAGWGDGVYACTWGLDERGDRVWLVTDFQVVGAAPVAK